MARNIKEIKNFNVGVVSNADPREVPDDAPILSYNVDSNAPGGVLRGRNGDRMIGAHYTLSTLKVDLGVTLGATLNTTDLTLSYNGNISLKENDYIVMGNPGGVREVMKVTNIAQNQNPSNGVLTIERAQFFGTAQTFYTSEPIYRVINPIAAISYIPEEAPDKENVVLFSENGHVDGVYDWNSTQTINDDPGDGINTPANIDGVSMTDFSSFPLNFKSNNSLAITKKNNNFYIGAGSSEKSKWLGRISKANISGKSGVLLEDAKLSGPGYGTDSTDYDKIITFQHSFSTGGTVEANAKLGNTTKVLHIAYKKGTPYLYAIDADTGQAHTSSPLPFNVHNITKCVSTVSDIKIWAYVKNSEDDTSIVDNPGSIYLINIFSENDVNDGEVTMGDNGYFDTGNGWVPIVHQKLNINFAPEGSHPRGTTDNYGYPSEPKYTKGSQSGHAYGGGQEISDILETVDDSGNGKLWILASPLDEDDEDPYNNWFRVTGYLRTNTNHCCFRFLWASYERYEEDGTPLDHISGDSWDDGGERNIWFNDKSFSMIQTSFIGDSSQNSYVGGQSMIGMSGSNFRFRNLKRSVPSIGDLTSAATTDYTEPQEYENESGLAISTGVGDRANYCILHGGGPFFREPGVNNLSNGIGLNTVIQREIIDAKGDIETDGQNFYTTYVYNEGEDDEYYSSQYDNNRVATMDVTFKPLPNSLVDLSDLYAKPGGGSTPHVVGCYVNFNEGYMAEDIWLSTHNPGDGSNKSAIGWRMRNLANSTCMWISSGDIKNYGAHYVRNNAFGYRESDNSSDGDLNQAASFSTLCCDVDEDVIRVMKWLPSQLPNNLHTTLRNKSMTEFNGLALINDNAPKHSTVFSTHEILEDELASTGFTQLSKIGEILKLNTTQELVDKYAPLVFGTPAASISGYNLYEGHSNSYTSNTSSLVSDVQSPVNDDAVFQLKGEVDVDSSTSNKSLDVEKLSPIGGLTASASTDCESIIPNGPGEIITFGNADASDSWAKKGYLFRLPFNGFAGTESGTNCILHNTYFNIRMGLSDNNPLFLLSSNSQSCFTGNSGPYETTDIGSANMSDLGHTKQFYLKLFETTLNSGFSNRLVQGQTTDIAEVQNLLLAHIWPEGQPAGNYSDSGTESASADTGTNYSKYGSNNYRLTFFNKTGQKSAFNCTISDEYAGFMNPTDDFSDSPTDPTVAFSNSIFPYALSKHQKTLDLIGMVFENGETALPGDETEYYEYFPTETTRWYRLSYEYDGFQESPMSNDFVYRNNSTSVDYSSINITITLPTDIPPRATRISVWRLNEEGGLFKRVKTLKLTPSSWEAGAVGGRTVMSKSFIDKGPSSIDMDYETWAHISPFTLNTNVNYGISTSLSNYLFVADVSHPDIKENKSSTIIRSEPGKYSMFDVLSADNLLTLDSTINALAGFQGRLYAFTDNNVVRISPEQMVEEDILEGFGCSHKDAVVVTEYGMFYADRNHIYQHDGSSSKIISYPIETDDFSGKNVSWQNMAATGDIKAIFDSKLNQVMFAVDALDSTETYTGTYLWSYHVLKQRWDLKKFNSSSVQSRATGLTFFKSLSNNKIYSFDYPTSTSTSISSTVVEINQSSSTPYQWISKKLSMEGDTIVKRFLKIKVEADATIDMPSVFIDDSEVSLTSTGKVSGAGTYEYKIAGAQKKGKTIHLKWGEGAVDSDADFKNDGATIFSIGIIYRQGKVK